jgi:hypothetical protein
MIATMMQSQRSCPEAMIRGEEKLVQSDKLDDDRVEHKKSPTYCGGLGIFSSAALTASAITQASSSIASRRVGGIQYSLFSGNISIILQTSRHQRG